MNGLARIAVLSALSAASSGLGLPAGAMPAWMSEAAMRSAFIGKTLDGHYIDGLSWTETYRDDGRLDYREKARFGVGSWYFKGHVFCTFYEPGYGLNGGCWNAEKTGANCYEFYAAATEPDDDAGPDPLGSWTARAWRQGEPSTCAEKPSA